MRLELEKLGPNVTKVYLADRTVLFSYETPVAVFSDGRWHITEEFHSKTTSKHINQHCTDHPKHPNVKVTPERIVELVSG